MKKLLAVVVAALVIAVALWVAMRIERANRRITVAELLPQSTLLLAHIPDFQRTREQWHASDLYALWREPSVKAWLQEPLARIGKGGGSRRTLNDFLALEPQDGFLALTSLENNEPKFVGGFHFNQSTEKTRRFIEEREAPLLAKSGSAKREKVSYHDHTIETINAGRFALATVYDRDWFFVSNDLASLEAMLDRSDRRTARGAATLLQNEAFAVAAKHFNRADAATFFLDPKPFLEKLLPLVAMTGQTSATRQLQRLEQVRSIAGSFALEKGKMREMIFVAMPRQGPEKKLDRAALRIASPATFFYSAALVRWPAPDSPAALPSPLPPFLQRFADAFGKANLAAADLPAAFADELEVIGEWSMEAHWPTLMATLAVKDAGRARRIVDALTSVDLPAAPWSKTEKAGVSYYNSVGFGGLVPIHPTIALSNQLLVAGSDPAGVEAAVMRQAPAAGTLEKSETFREASALLPAADSSFNYIDTRLLFERADAALRPLLLMSATIYPALGQKVDAAKLPPADAIAKHLTPIVMSQRYVGEGYLSESIGPVTFNEAMVGLAGAIGGAYIFMQRGLGGTGLLQPSPTPAFSATPRPAPAFSATPSPTQP